MISDLKLLRKIVNVVDNNVAEYPLYPEPDEDLSFMERAVTIVTNNLSIATVSIPIILLGPSLPLVKSGH